MEEFFDKMHRALVRAAVDKHSPMRNAYLATVDADGQPRQRTIVLRRYRHENGAHFTFHTDDRSDKMNDLRVNPKVSLLFWHPRQRLQIRAAGTLTWENQTERTRGHWNALHVWGRKSYATKLPPGTPLNAPSDNLPDLWREKPPVEATEYAYPNFTLLDVEAHELELLELDREAHRRAVWRFEEEKWRGTWIVP